MRGPRRSVLTDVAVLAAAPAVLAIGLVLDGPWGALALAVLAASAALLAAGWERRTPALRQLLPAVVMASVAAVGRVLFAALPDVKPVSAVAILAGALLGRRSGFLCGALAGFLSNMALGQGPWTPWQMYAWGLMGFVAGCAGPRLLDGRLRLCAFGFAACLVYGWILDAYAAAAFLHPSTPAAVIAAFAASLPFDTVHGAATAGFLLVLAGPWGRAVRRAVRRYGLRGREG